MRVAVLTLTRDRLEYTQHCFASLRRFAGCDYDHYVLDQGSTDGTNEWLKWVERPRADWKLCVVRFEENVGISAGMNRLLDIIGEFYDVVVKMDNDCELTTPNTLRDISQLVHEQGDVLLSPVIHGLNQPPVTTRRRTIADKVVEEKQQIGGIFLAAPKALYADFRYAESNPSWGMDDVQVCRHWRSQGGWCGYLQGYAANHYETTAGQHQRYPGYFEQKRAEGLPA